MELMVVVGIMGIVMMGTMRLFQDAFLTQNRVEAGQDTILITDQLASILGDAPTCTTLLKGTKSDNGTPIVLGTALYGGAQVGRATITSIELQDVSSLTEDVYFAKVQLKGTKAKDGSAQFAREVPIVYRTNEQKYISECLGDNFGIAGNCTALGGKWDSQKRGCDFCGALGGELNDQGRCQLAGTSTASCPFQKAFGANSINLTCSGAWDSDYVTDALRYLSSFSHVSDESIESFKRDITKALNNPPNDNLPVKVLGAMGGVSWVITMEPPDSESQKPCSVLVFFTVNCP